MKKQLQIIHLLVYLFLYLISFTFVEKRQKLVMINYGEVSFTRNKKTILKKKLKK